MHLWASEIRNEYRLVQEHYNGIKAGMDPVFITESRQDPEKWKDYTLREAYGIMVLLDRRRLPKEAIIYDSVHPGNSFNGLIDVEKTIEVSKRLLLQNPNAFSKKHRYSHTDYFQVLPSRIEQKMAKADWYYEYSDDHRVWQKGSSEIKGILKDLQMLTRNEQGFEMANKLWEKYVPEYSVSKPDFLNDDKYYQKIYFMTEKELKEIEHKFHEPVPSIRLDEKGNLVGIKQDDLVNYLAVRLHRADWGYSFSDDINVRMRGSDEIKNVHAELSVLALSNGGGAKAEELWLKYGDSSFLDKPDYIKMGMFLSAERLQRPNETNVSILTNVLEQRLKDFNWDSKGWDATYEFLKIRDQFKMLTQFEGGEKIAAQLWELHIGNKLEKPKFLVTPNQFIMTEKEVNHIRQQFKNIGAEKAFTPELVAELKTGIPAKTHGYQFNNNGDKVDVYFSLKRANDSKLYFLNKYGMAVVFDNGKKAANEIFYVTGQDNVKLKPGEKKLSNVNVFTIKRAANYLAGRPVFNAFSDKPGNQYEAWAKRKFNVEKGEFEMVKYRKEYPFDMKEATKNYSMKDLATPEYEKRLFESYKRGNLQLATFIGSDGKEEKLYTSLNIGLIKGGSLDVYDLNKDKVPIQQLVDKGYVGNDFAQQIKDRLSQKNGSHKQEVDNKTRSHHVGEEKIIKPELEPQRNKQRLS